MSLFGVGVYHAVCGRTMKSKKGFSLIGILIAAVIVALLMYRTIKTYYKKQSTEKQTHQSLSGQKTGPRSYSDMVKDTKDAAQDFNKSAADREKQFKQIE